MSIAIPIRRGQQAQIQRPAPPPPDPVYTMMAAAQMHSEGRLLKPDQDAKLASTQPAKAD